MKILNFFIVTIFIAFYGTCFTLNFQLKEAFQLDKKINYQLYTSTEFPLLAHVVIMPVDEIDFRLIPSVGQREEVLSIAKRSKAYIAVNGSNYRRGGRYNGNRLNLFYLHQQIYSDLGFLRGSLAWNNKKKKFVIDKILLNTKFLINDKSLNVDQINQPRIKGQSILYNDKSDLSMLIHTPGINVIINKDKFVEEITTDKPMTIPSGYYIYQTDKLENITKGMKVKLEFDIKSMSSKHSYNNYDFVIGGAGLLIFNNEIVSNQLYDEFSQGTDIVHCNDEVAADFHTKTMQEWLIEQRHPRTAIGINHKNEICIVAIDGRQKNSDGLTLNELTLFMKQLNCVDALNLGGGGCTTLCIKNKIINNPSTQVQRPVSEALCFFIK